MAGDDCVKGGDCTEIVARGEDSLKIKVTAPPLRGKANKVSIEGEEITIRF